MDLKAKTRHFWSVITSVLLTFLGITIPQADSYFPNNVVEPIQQFICNQIYDGNCTIVNASNPGEFENHPVGYSWGLYAGMFPLGGFLAAILAPFAVDRMGRRQAYLIFSTLSSLAKLSQFISRYGLLPLLFVGRFIGGFGNNGIDAIVPVIISEISHKSVRGRLGSLQSFAFGIGVSFAALLGLESLFGNIYWNWAWFLLFVASLSAFPIVAFMKETPAYLASKMVPGKPEKVQESLLFYRGSAEDFDSVVEDSRKPRPKGNIFRQIGGLFSDKTVRKQTWITAAVRICYLPVNVTAMFSTTMLHSVGLEIIDSQHVTVFLTVSNIFVVLASILVADKWGRRPTAVWTCGIGTAVLFLQGALQAFVNFFPMDSVWPPVPYIGVFLMFAINSVTSLGPRVLFWVLVPEIFPFQYRLSAKFFGMLIFALFSAPYYNLLPPLFESGYGFAVYISLGVQNAIATFVIWRWLPETRNLSPKDIYKLFNPSPEPTETEPEPQEYYLNKSVHETAQKP